jgi:transcriptional regulator with XRE-family HTH domain
MNSIEIGRKIRQLRKNAEMSQERLGELLGLSYQQVQKYENGQTRIHIEILAKISEIFSVPVQALLRSAETHPPIEGAAERGSYGYGIEDFRESELMKDFRSLHSPLSKEFALRFVKNLVELEKELRNIE